LSNALKFSPAGGTVRLTAEARVTEIVIRVSDTGPGIPRDKWDEVFDRFVQLPSTDSGKTSGAGLGLFIARQIIEKHGGRIWLDSEVGQGTEFVISLPLEPQPTKPNKRGNECAGSVVVCDADPALAAMMAQVLRENNYDVHIAHSGRRLLEHVSHIQPQVVITDIALPDMKAMDLFDALAETETENCVLIVHSVDAELQELARHGVDLVLRRPATPDDFVQAARIALHWRRGSGALALLVNGWGMDSDRLCQHLSAHNHMVIVAADVAAGVQKMHDCHYDVVIAKVGAEGGLSQSIHMLTQAAGPSTRIIGLSNLMNRRECLAESTDAMTYVQYTRGDEETAAADISGYCQSQVTEGVL
jgi:DNA-binding response OmpR family regulator